MALCQEARVRLGHKDELLSSELVQWPSSILGDSRMWQTLPEQECGVAESIPYGKAMHRLSG